MKISKRLLLASLVFTSGAWFSGVALGADAKITLSGANEVPPVQTSASGDEVAVINLMGQVFMGTAISPFRIVDALVDEAQTMAETIVVDLHAEATSEKVAMAQYLDGRVTAVVGTHTHVQTADEHVSEHGTAAITDVGMCGPFASVIGVRSEIILRRFLTELPAQFEVADGDVRIDALVVTAEGGRATAVERLERRC